MWQTVGSPWISQILDLCFHARARLWFRHQTSARRGAHGINRCCKHSRLDLNGVAGGKKKYCSSVHATAKLSFEAEIAAWNARDHRTWGWLGWKVKSSLTAMERLSISVFFFFFASSTRSSTICISVWRSCMECGASDICVMKAAKGLFWRSLHSSGGMGWKIYTECERRVCTFLMYLGAVKKKRIRVAKPLICYFQREGTSASHHTSRILGSNAAIYSLRCHQKTLNQIWWHDRYVVVKEEENPKSHYRFIKK